MVDLDAERRLRRRTLWRMLWYVVYGVALFALSVMTFGPAGVWPGLLIPLGWGYVFLSRSRPDALARVVIALVVGLLALSVFLPVVQQARGASRRNTCKNNLRHIGLALHNFHDVHGSFPPAYAIDENGRPLHSWRVLLLPYLDEGELYVQLDLKKPWDDPANLALLTERMPEVYRCPSTSGSGANTTHYIAVTGEGTAWPVEGASRIADFTDGTSNSALVVECDAGIPWYEPRDLTLAEALPVLTSLDGEAALGHVMRDFLYDDFIGRHVVLADGSARFLSHGLDADVWRELLLIDDGSGNEWDSAATRAEVKSERLKFGNCVRLGVFLFLAIFPLPWVWLNPRSEVGIPK